MKQFTLEGYVSRHEHFLENFLNQIPIPAPSLKEAMSYSLFSGGKRLRPLLVYLSGELLGADIETLDTIAAAVELLHCCSLVHDDLPAMDNDSTRRGKPSCHCVFSEATAILTGSAIQASAVELLLTHLPKTLPTSCAILVTLEIIRAIGPSGMASGQSLDIEKLADHRLQEPQLKYIHQLKTSKLFLACINMVIAAAQPTRHEANALRQCAEQFGLAFQLQDDYLDHYSPKGSGKSGSSDRLNQKRTFASFYSQEDLGSLIQDLYQQAYDALSQFGPRAKRLIAFLSKLEKRSQQPKLSDALI